MWKVSSSPAPSSVLFMLLFVDMLDVEGVNWKQMLCACTLTWLECGCGSKLKMAERLEDQENKSGSYLKYHTDLAITIKTLG